MFTPADPGTDATDLLQKKIADAIQRFNGDADKAARELVFELQMRATEVGTHHTNDGPCALYSIIGGFTD